MLDRAVAETGHLVGSSFTLADMNLLPMMFYLEKLPESGAMLRQNAKLSGVLRPPHGAATSGRRFRRRFPGRSSWTIES